MADVHVSLTSAFVTQYLFLCGVGRSGTTVFRTSLGLHRDIYYNNRENNIVQDLLKVAHRNCSLESRKYAMAVSQDQYNQVFQRTISDLIWPEAISKNKPVHLAAINPEGSQLDYLCDVFPNAKVICLVRNGIEVVSSRTQYASFASLGFESHCQVWNRSRSVVHWGSNNAERFKLFRQEWFYDSSKIKAELEELSDWLEIQHDAEPANQILNQLHHPTEGIQSAGGNRTLPFDQMDSRARESYFRSKRDRWLRWSNEERLLFTIECGEFMNELGYELPWANRMAA